MFQHGQLRRIRRRGPLRARRLVLAGGLIVIGAATLATLTVLALMRELPEWWRTVRRDDPQTIALADLVQNSVMTQLYRVRDGGPIEAGGDGQEWSVSIRANQANAWLNASLPKWMASQHPEFRWPKELAEVQVDFADSAIRVGARVRAGASETVISATLRPALQADGSLWVPAAWVRFGRLPVPAGWALDRAIDHRGGMVPAELLDLPETLAMLRAFLGEEPLVASAVVDLGDGRRVRLLKLTPRDGRLDVTCRTEHRLADAPRD